MIWQAFEAVVIIFILVGAGVFIAWRKWVSRDVAKVFSHLVINLTLPCTLLYTMKTYSSRQDLLDSWLPFLVIIIMIPAIYFLSVLIAAVLKVPKSRRGVFTVLFSFSNNMFIGFPVVEALFGPPGMPYAIFYYLVGTMIFFLFGFYAIQRDADYIKGEKSARIPLRQVFKRLITVPIVASIGSFIIVLLDIQLPDTIMTATQFIGNMTTPLSLMFMGTMIYFIGLKGMKYEKGIGLVLLGRYIIIPGVAFAISMLAIAIASPSGPTSELILMRNVYTVETGLPAIVMTAIIAERYGADVKYATKNVVWTTLASLIAIPAYMILFQYI